MKETKAHRIYRQNFYESKKHIEAFGLDFNPNGKAIGWNSLSADEAISTRTINAVAKELENDKKQTAIAYKLEVINQAELNKRAQVWMMIESTIENARQNLI